MSSEQVWTMALNLSGFEVVAATVELADQREALRQLFDDCSLPPSPPA